MPAAEQHEVRERSRAAPRPVVDVMDIQEAAVLAAREAAAEVPRWQRPPQRRRDRACPSASADDGRVAGEPTRRLRNERAPVGELAAAVTVGREGRLVRVNDDLVALAARATRALVGERRLGERDQRFRVRSLARRPRFRGTAPRGVAHRLQRPQDQRSVLGGEPAVDRERPVRLPGDAQVRVLLQLPGLLGRDAPEGADRPLELGGGAGPGQLEQLLLVLHRRDPGEGAHLRVRQLAPREAGMDERELRQPPGDTNVLAGRPGGEPAPPGQPLRARTVTGLRPAASAVELPDQLQPPARPCIQVRREHRQLRLELVEAQRSELPDLACCHV